MVETDDPSIVAMDAATFGPFFDFAVYPVLDIQDIAGIAGQAVAFRKAVS